MFSGRWRQYFAAAGGLRSAVRRWQAGSQVGEAGADAGAEVRRQFEVNGWCCSQKWRPGEFEVSGFRCSSTGSSVGAVLIRRLRSRSIGDSGEEEKLGGVLEATRHQLICDSAKLWRPVIAGTVRCCMVKDDCLKAINEISSLQAVILSSQLKDMVCNVGRGETGRRLHGPIKLVCHPKEPFFVIRKPEKVTAIFPMRFRDHSDVVIATSFFQELMDVGYSTADAKTPRCTWSPIPPPELRGEYVHYLTTNGGFVSFDIVLEHFKGAKADKILWTLLNFNAFVKNHVKSTRGFIQRKMRQHLRSMTEVIQNARIGQDQNNEKLHSHKFAAKMKTFSSKSKALKRKCSAIAKQINRIRLRIKIKGLDRLRRRWFRVPKITSFKKHPKTD